MADAPPQGWYPDPSDDAQLRWWDGQRWTDHTHPAVAGQSAGVATAVAEQHRQSATEPRSAMPGDATAGARDPWAGMTSQAAGSDEPGMADPGGSLPSHADLLGGAAGTGAPTAAGSTPEPAAAALQATPAAEASAVPLQPSPGANAALPPHGAGVDDAAAQGMATPLAKPAPWRLGPLSFDRRLGMVLGAVLFLVIGFFVGRETAPEAPDVFDQVEQPAESGVPGANEAVPTPGAAPADAGDVETPATPDAGASGGPANATDTGLGLEGVDAAMQAARSAQSLVEACAAADIDGSYNGCNDESVVADAYDAKQVTLAGLTASADSYEITMTVARGTDAGASFTITKGPNGIERTCEPATATGCSNGTWT